MIAPRVWTHADPEPPMIPDPPPLRDRYGVRWVADEREDGFAGWRSDSHGFRAWRRWFNLAHERGPLTEDRGQPREEPVPCPLTQAELDVVTIAASGGNCETAAHKLTVSVQTVNYRLARSKTKLGTRNTTNTVAVCVARGWVTPTELKDGDARESA